MNLDYNPNNTITVTLEGTNPDDGPTTYDITLTSRQVVDLLTNNKAYQKKITELEDKVKSEQQSYRWANERASTAQRELDALHSVFTALGVPETDKNNNTLPLTTRFALNLVYQQNRNQS